MVNESIDYGYKVGDRVKSILPLKGRKLILRAVVREILPNGKVKIQMYRGAECETVMGNTIEKCEEIANR
jgi:hypothetical protein